VSTSTVRFISFPLTEAPPKFCAEIVSAFTANESKISTRALKKGLTSNDVLTVLRDDLVRLGFQVEAGQQKNDKIQRPVFFGEGGIPTRNYQIDGYHQEWRCGFEVEAGRAWMGNAIYRDLIQGLVMVQVDTLVLAVPNAYRYNSGGRSVISTDFDNTKSVAESLYGHTRVRMPYGLILIGY